MLASGLLIGAGHGLSMLSLLLAVQHGVDRAHLGIATSLNQFSRSVGAAVGVAAMGALLARQLTGVSMPGGAEALAATGVHAHGRRRGCSSPSALHHVFVAGAGSRPRRRSSRPSSCRRSTSHAACGAAAGEQMLAAEMTNLEPEDEPVAVRE